MSSKRDPIRAHEVLESLLFGKSPFPEGMDREPTKEEFTDWLLTQPLDKTFQTNNEETCPLACYAKEKFNPEACFRYSLGKKKATDLTEPEQWAARFAAFVDAEPTETITVRRALDLLKK